MTSNRSKHAKTCHFISFVVSVSFFSMVDIIFFKFFHMAGTLVDFFAPFESNFRRNLASDFGI